MFPDVLWSSKHNETKSCCRFLPHCLRLLLLFLPRVTPAFTAADLYSIIISAGSAAPVLPTQIDSIKIDFPKTIWLCHCWVWNSFAVPHYLQRKEVFVHCSNLLALYSIRFLGLASPHQFLILVLFWSSHPYLTWFAPIDPIWGPSHSDCRVFGFLTSWLLLCFPGPSSSIWTPNPGRARAPSLSVFTPLVI